MQSVVQELLILKSQQPAPTISTEDWVVQSTVSNDQVSIQEPLDDVPERKESAGLLGSPEILAQDDRSQSIMSAQSLPARFEPSVASTNRRGRHGSSFLPASPFWGASPQSRPASPRLESVDEKGSPVTQHPRMSTVELPSPLLAGSPLVLPAALTTPR